MIEPSELDIAELRYEFRQLYLNLGFIGATQVLYELLVSANILAEIIAEEKQKEGKE
jgi:hypothetical protein